MNGSELMDMMGEQMAKENGERIDSIVSFKELMKTAKDSVAKLSLEEQEKLKQFENFQVHMLMDAKKKKLEMDMISEFENISEMQDMFETMNAISEFEKQTNPNSKVQSNPLSILGSEGVSTTKYAYNENVFKREVVIKDEEKLVAINDSLGQAEMMFASSGYTLNYFFPKKIKSVSIENAKISEDGKSFSVSVNLMEYLKNPRALNVEVELEK